MAVNVTEGNSISGNTVKFSSYALRKCLIGFGAVNGVLNAVIFRFMHSGDMTVQFDFVGIVADLAITGLILGAILFACAVPLTKRDMRAGAFVSPETFGGVAGVVPRSYGVAMLVVAVVAGAFMGFGGRCRRIRPFCTYLRGDHDGAQGLRVRFRRSSGRLPVPGVHGAVFWRQVGCFAQG